MPSADNQGKTADVVSEKDVDSMTEPTLLPATVDFTQPHLEMTTANIQSLIVTRPPAQTSANRSRRSRWIAPIVAGIGGLLVIYGIIALMVMDGKGTSTIEAPVELSCKAKEPQVAEPSLQKVDINPLVIVEPPDLVSWLKGRTILTVAQDGSGQFSSIQAALNALQPGQVVEVLDVGPYRERLSLRSPPQDVGLISRVQTRVEFDRFEPGSAGDIPVGHDWVDLSQFRIHGFEFVIPDNPEAGKRDVICFHIANSKGVVFESCAVHRTNTDTYLVFANANHAAVPPHVIRECALEVHLQAYSHQSDSEVLVLRNLFSVSLRLVALFKECVVRNNIFLDSHFVSHVIHSDAYECSNNTFLGRRPSIHIDTKGMAAEYEEGQRWARGEKPEPVVIERGRAPTGHGVIFNNLHSHEGFLHVSGGGEHDPWPWEIGYNCYPGDGNIPAEYALPSPTNTLAMPILYGIKPRNPNFARLKPDSPGTKSGKAGAWPIYAGALPPGLAPKEGDWLTEMQSRWFKDPSTRPAGATRPPNGPNSLLWFQKPEFDIWMNEIADLPPERLAEQVTRKLVELNPGFDGKVDLPIENGIIRVCKFHTDHVTDISPVRALRDLKVLVATGSKRTGAWNQQTGSGRLSNLSPLRWMPLEYLEVFDNPWLENISPLAGMPLKTLHCEQTDVADLTPLNGMKLEATSWSNTRIWDLSIFRGMPIRYLTCEFTDVSDLSPLAGMPLTFLACGYSRINDLTPLRAMPLEFLNCNGTGVTDLSPLSQSRLARLFCCDGRVSDLTPLRGLPLKEIYIKDTSVTDVTPLRKTDLETVLFDASKTVKGMPALRHMPSLKTIRLDWSETRIPAAEFWKRYDAGEFGEPTTSEIEPDVAGDEEKPIRPHPIQEPAALQDWLQGRTVLTVAQDGSGQFGTIQEALNALQTGQVVKVLDKGPYHERLNWTNPPADVGLISEVQTTIVLPELTRGPANIDEGHRIHQANQLRIHGIEFVFPKVEQGRHATVIMFWQPAAVVFENCAVRRQSDGSFTTFGSLRGEPDRPNLIRDCYFENILQVYSSDEQGSVVVLRNYLAGEHGLNIEAKFKLCCVRHNIFAPTVKSAFVQNVLASDWFDFSNNTILSFPHAIMMDTRTALFTFEKWDRVRKGIEAAPQIESGHAPAGAGAIYNNLHSRAGFLNVTGGGEREPWSWKVAYNVYPGDGTVLSMNAMRRASNTMATPMFYSVWTKDADFARLRPDSPGATSAIGEGWPNYAGALPPGTAPKEGDWFTRLRNRWMK